MRREYFREIQIVEDIETYRIMLRQHEAGSDRYKEISQYITELKGRKAINRKKYAGDHAYFSRGNPSTKMALRVSKKQQILDELYQEKKEKKFKIFNLELEVESIDKRIKEVKASRKGK
jgi:hypothetical protein